MPPDLFRDKLKRQLARLLAVTTGVRACRSKVELSRFARAKILRLVWTKQHGGISRP